MPLEVVHLTDEYWSNVVSALVLFIYLIFNSCIYIMVVVCCVIYYIMFQVSYIIDEYRYGRTPNPDVLCNTRIKFGMCLKFLC